MLSCNYPHSPLCLGLRIATALDGIALEFSIYYLKSGYPRDTASNHYANDLCHKWGNMGDFRFDDILEYFGVSIKPIAMRYSVSFLY